MIIKGQTLDDYKEVSISLILYDSQNEELHAV